MQVRMLRFGAVVLALVLVTSCWGMQDVLDTLSAENQNQIVTVLQKAVDQHLIDLSTGGPYTIFAPTDAAFSKLSSDELNQLTNDPDTLSSVLKYHVIQGETFSWDMHSGSILNTISGHLVRIYKTGQSIYVNNGHVVKGDLEANNAVIYLIDEVLDVPEGSIYAVAKGSSYPLSTFASYVDETHMNHTLDRVDGSHRYTVFAPSDDAFAKLSPVILERLHASGRYLSELIAYHIHPGTLHLASLDRNSSITTLVRSHKISITVDPDVHLNHLARLEETDIDCDNGVIHIIDHVLIPASLGSIIG